MVCIPIDEEVNVKKHAGIEQVTLYIWTMLTELATASPGAIRS